MEKYLNISGSSCPLDDKQLRADFASHGEKRDILKFGMAFYKKNLVACGDLS